MARDEALIVYLYAVVARMDVGDHLPCIAGRA